MGKIIGFILFALFVVAFALTGCFLLLPVYEKPLAQYLSTQSDVADSKGHYSEAIAELTQAAQLDPQNALILNNLAWILATCPEASSRDGKKALDYANRACKLTNWQEGAYVDTLAAACAETGDYDNAVKWENKYLTSLSLSASDATDGQARLSLYKSHQPYHADQ
jgi:tetratricopeptide (TPR) repeat protein